MRRTLCQIVLYTTPIEISFHHFENVVLGSLKCIFQSNHQVDIKLYLTETPAHRDSKELASMKASCCIFRPISLLASQTLISFYSNDDEGYNYPPPFGGPLY